jgi:uncharacterized protein DUF3108
MKFPLFLLFCTLGLYALGQNCSNHLLFQKGVRLEYDYYMAPLTSSIPAKNSHLVFEVIDTGERDGSTYNTIVKKGYSLKSKKDHFQRTITLKCDGKTLFIPFDFYTSDTIYLKDLFPDKPNEGYAEAFLPFSDDVTYNVPLNLKGIDSLQVGVKKYVQKGNHRGFDLTTLIQEDYEIHYTINSIKLAGKETIKTAAGNFECYKFAVDETAEISKSIMPAVYFLYLNNEIGLVKLEASSGYIELVKFKK